MMRCGDSHILQQQQQESPYGSEVSPEKAPEVISRSVASLPPEQMFELMKQMKQCVHNNPNEAKSLLITNPQLSYALLQVIEANFLDIFLLLPMIFLDMSLQKRVYMFKRLDIVCFL